MEFSSGILGGEAPLDDGTGLIAFPLQSLDFPAEGFLVGQPLPETVAGEDTELDLRHPFVRLRTGFSQLGSTPVGGRIVR